MVFGGIDKSDHALMARTFADGVEAVGIGKLYADVFVCRLFQHFARAYIVFGFLDIEFDDGFGVLPHSGVDGMEAVDRSLVCHMVLCEKGSDGIIAICRYAV